MFEYFLNKTTDTTETDEVTAQVPAYIPSGCRSMAPSPDLNMVVIHTIGDPGAVYVYNYLFNGETKLQSAWSRWSFPGATDILSMTFDKGWLTCVVRRPEGCFIERLNCEQRSTDLPDAFTAYLDRQVRLQGVYNSNTNRTEYTLPYDVTNTLVAVTSASSGPYTIAGGSQLTYQIDGAKRISVAGNRSGQWVRFGYKYTSVYEFSEFFQRSQDGKQVTQDGRIQLLSLAVNYASSAYFKVEVTAEGRPTRSYPFNGREVTSQNNIAGLIVLDTGKFSFPIMSRADRAKIRLVSDSWSPCGFISAEWRGTFNPASRQV
jgi:hypothetical protein